MGGFGYVLAYWSQIKRVAQMPEGFLLRDDGDVVLGGVGGELARVLRRDAAAGWPGERVGRVLLGVLEVEGVDVDLVGGELCGSGASGKRAWERGRGTDRRGGRGTSSPASP